MCIFTAHNRIKIRPFVFWTQFVHYFKVIRLHKFVFPNRADMIRIPLPLSVCDTARKRPLEEFKGYKSILIIRMVGIMSCG